jgi:hypothetical protein
MRLPLKHIRRPTRSPALYETRTGDNHHHLVCRGCGKVADVDCVIGVLERVCQQHWKNVDPDLGAKVEAGVKAKLAERAGAAVQPAHQGQSAVDHADPKVNVGAQAYPLKRHAPRFQFCWDRGALLSAPP